jgi:hypothetical protein
MKIHYENNWPFLTVSMCGKSCVGPTLILVEEIHIFHRIIGARVFNFHYVHTALERFENGAEKSQLAVAKFFENVTFAVTIRGRFLNCARWKRSA